MLKILLIGSSLLATSNDEFKEDSPDKYERLINRKDNKIENRNNEYKPTNEEKIPKFLEALEKKGILEKQFKEISEHLNVDNLASLTNRDLWNDIYKSIMDQIHDFLKGKELSISFPIRYSMCFFIIPIISADKFLIFPAFYKFLIPSRIKSHESISKFLNSFDKLLNFIKKQSENDLLVNIYLKRNNTLKEEIEIIKMMPDLIVSDPVKIVRWISDFRAETPGYIKQV